MALDLIGGAVFSVLYDGVKQAIGRTETFKELLRDLKFTLECLRRQATAIQEIGRYNVELGLQNDEIEELERQMHRGARLVGKLLNFRLWNYCCINCYTDQLVDLDRSLRRLLENLMLQEIRDVKEILDLSRKNREELKEVKEAQVSMHKLLQQIAGSIVIEEASTSAAAGGDAIEMVALNEGNGGIQVASLDGRAGTALGEIFGMLLEVVIDVKDRNVMFKPLLEDLKSTLESLKPLVKEIAQNNTVLDRPNEELKTFAMKMEDGVKLVCKCSKVRLWASYKKYQYTNKILGLDEFCRRQLSMLKEQVARDVRETSASIRNVKEEMLDFIRNIEMVLKRMKLNTGVAQEPYDKDQSTSIPECYETVADYGRRKNVVTKRHLPGIGGGAPFIACYKCSHLLQMPAGFRLSRRKWHKLKCGACSAVLKFLLGKNSQLLPYEVLSAKKPPTDEVDRRPDSQHEELDSSNDFVDSPLHYHSPKKGLSYYNVDTGTSDSPQSVSRTSDIWTTDLESRGETTYRASIDSNTSSGAGTSLFSEEKTSTLRRKDDDDQSTNWPYSEGIQAERLPWEVKNTDSYTTSVAGTSLFSEEETSTFRSKDDNQSTDGHILETSNLRDFKFAELQIATRNFSPELMIGEGGFGRVFKGWLDKMTLSPSKPGTGMAVAIKKLKQESLQGIEEWQTEVNFAGRLSHPNIVKLLGCCWEKKELLLVYEFMPRGSLQNHLFRRTSNLESLSWETRIEVAIGAAQGLAFLHSLGKQVIFRDFKSSNVLLDGNYNAKLSDFVLATLGPIDGNSHVSTRVMGTYGYAAPEYIATGHLYAKSDVYSFGVVLLEILTGLRASDPNRPKEEQNLVEWAKPLLSNKRTFKKVMDVRMEGQYSLNAAFKAGQLSLKCLVPHPKNRPSMKEVVEELEQILAIKKQLSPTSS